MDSFASGFSSDRQLFAMESVLVAMKGVAGAAGVTTVRQPTYEMGTAAARRLIERLEGDDSSPQTIVFDPEWIVRASSLKTRTIRQPLKRKSV